MRFSTDSYPMLFCGGDYDAMNVVMAWQGHRDESTLYKIASTGSATQTTLRNVGVTVTDQGFYGAGINFTQWPRFVGFFFPLLCPRSFSAGTPQLRQDLRAEQQLVTAVVYLCRARVSGN